MADVSHGTGVSARNLDWGTIMQIFPLNHKYCHLEFTKTRHFKRSEKNHFFLGMGPILIPRSLPGEPLLLAPNQACWIRLCDFQNFSQINAYGSMAEVIMTNIGSLLYLFKNVSKGNGNNSSHHHLSPLIREYHFYRATLC